MQLLPAERFHTQRNNKYDPLNTCGNTTLANLFEASGSWFYSVQGEQLEDTIYEQLRGPVAAAYCKERYPDYMNHPETVADMLAFVATAMTGKPWKYIGNRNTAFIDMVLSNGQPVGVLGTFYKGGFHYVAITGDSGDDYIIADPFGDFRDEYKTKSGYGLLWPKKRLNEYWLGDCIYKHF